MLGCQAIGERVLELLEGIDLERPSTDEEVVVAGLQAYVQALGLPKPNVRIAPDVRALRMSRVSPARDRGAWQALAGRQWRLLDEGVSAGWRWTSGGWERFHPHMERPREETKLF